MGAGGLRISCGHRALWVATRTGSLEILGKDASQNRPCIVKGQLLILGEELSLLGHEQINAQTEDIKLVVDYGTLGRGEYVGKLDRL